MGEAERSHAHEALGDALAVFEREIDSGVYVRADGEVLVIVEVVETLGQITQSHAKLEGQLAVLIGVQRIVDERI